MAPLSANPVIIFEREIDALGNSASLFLAKVFLISTFFSLCRWDSVERNSLFCDAAIY
jgi:hypothetical protein